MLKVYDPMAKVNLFQNSLLGNQLIGHKSYHQDKGEN